MTRAGGWCACHETSPSTSLAPEPAASGPALGPSAAQAQPLAGPGERVSCARRSARGPCRLPTATRARQPALAPADLRGRPCASARDARRLCPALHAPHGPGRRDGRPHLGHLVCSELPGRGLAAASLGSSPAGHRRSVSSGKFSPRLTSEHFPFRGGQWESEKGDSPPLRQCGLLPYVRESAGTLPSRGEALHTSR